MGTRESKPGGATTPQATDARTACQAGLIEGQGAAEGAGEGADLVARLRAWADTMSRRADEFATKFGADPNRMIGASATLTEAADAIDAIPGIKRLTRLAAMEECIAIARRSGGNVYVAIKRIEAAANGECAKGVKADG